jgi:lipoyl synthase
MDGEELPQFVRASLGSAIALKLAEGRIDAKPSTIYLLTYVPGRCRADCRFCSQAKSSTSKADLLSRVSWPRYRSIEVLKALENSWRKGSVKRVCIQALNYPEVFSEIYALVKGITSRMEVPVSLSCQPVNSEEMRLLADAGLERIGIPLDASNPEVFDMIKGSEAGGPYLWKKHLDTIQEATEIFGKGKVSTHVMVGLGEKDSDIVKIIDDMVKLGVCPALFAFTPVHGTRMEGQPKPALKRYRWIQLARYLLVKGEACYEEMRFDSDGNLMELGVSLEKVREVIASGEPFITTGCVNCDRPYYNEEPKGPFYNYPRRPKAQEVAEMEKELLG